MNIQVLVAAMDQSDHSLIKKMNITTNAIIGNQCDRCSDEVFEENNKVVKYYSRADRGVGLNRNVTLLHSDDDCILLFADEDIVYHERYEEMIEKAFSEIPEADAIIFNVRTIGADVGRRENHRIRRVRFYNALNYGTPRIAVKSSSIRRNNILFHTCFGGGTRYSCGEDTLFIVDMLRAGLKLYTYPVCIADQYQYTSTWFNGYNEKYLHDKGALYAAISKKWAKLLCLQDLVRHKNIYKTANLSFGRAYRLMKQGIGSFQKLKSYKEITEKDIERE